MDMETTKRLALGGYYVIRTTSGRKLIVVVSLENAHGQVMIRKLRMKSRLWTGVTWESVSELTAQGLRAVDAVADADLLAAAKRLALGGPFTRPETR